MYSVVIITMQSLLWHISSFHFVLLLLRSDPSSFTKSDVIYQKGNNQAEQALGEFLFRQDDDDLDEVLFVSFVANNSVAFSASSIHFSTS